MAKKPKTRAERKFVKHYTHYLHDPDMDTAIKLTYWANKLDWKIGHLVASGYEESLAPGHVLDVLRDELNADGAPTEKGMLDTYIERLAGAVRREIDGFPDYEDFLWLVHNYVEDHNTSGGVKFDKLDFDVVDRHGFRPSINEPMIGTAWQHTGNGKVYRIVNFAWMGATDEWGYVHRCDNEQLVLVRPMRHLFGNRHNGEKRYIEVTQRNEDGSIKTADLPDCLKDGHVLDARGWCTNCGADMTHTMGQPG